MFGFNFGKFKKKKAEEKPQSFEEKLKNPDEEDEDDDQQFIKKEGESLEGLEENFEIELPGKSGAVRPEGNQQRNLDREHGGLEVKIQGEQNVVDAWDGRSEEVDRMGSVNAFQKASIKSMIWRYKKQKLDEAKEAIQEAAQEGAKQMRKQDVGHFDSRQGSMDQQGYVERIKHMQQDRSHEGGNGGFGMGM